jgi:hypothetical protein
LLDIHVLIWTDFEQTHCFVFHGSIILTRMIRLIQNKLFYVPVFWPHAYGVSFKAIDASSILIPHFGIQSSLSLSLSLSLDTHTHQNIFLATTHAKVWTENKTPCVSWQNIRIKLRQANSKVIRKRMSSWLDILIMWATRYEIFSISTHCVHAYIALRNARREWPALFSLFSNLLLGFVYEY